MIKEVYPGVEDEGLKQLSKFQGKLYPSIDNEVSLTVAATLLDDNRFNPLPKPLADAFKDDDSFLDERLAILDKAKEAIEESQTKTDTVIILCDAFHDFRKAYEQKGCESLRF